MKPMSNESLFKKKCVPVSDTSEPTFKTQLSWLFERSQKWVVSPILQNYKLISQGLVEHSKNNYFPFLCMIMANLLIQKSLTKKTFFC